MILEMQYEQALAGIDPVLTAREEPQSDVDGREWTLLIGPAGIGVLPGEYPGYEGVERVVVVPKSAACEDTERPVYEIERDRFGTMYSGPLEIGECLRVQVVRDAEESWERIGVLEEALDDAAAYLRLGVTWIEDGERRGKMKDAAERAGSVLASEGTPEEARDD